MLVRNKGKLFLPPPISSVIYPVARHTAERMSSSTILLVVAAVLHLLGVDFGLSKLASQLVLELPNSRKQELEGMFVRLPRL